MSLSCGIRFNIVVRNSNFLFNNFFPSIFSSPALLFIRHATHFTCVICNCDIHRQKVKPLEFSIRYKWHHEYMFAAKNSNRKKINGVNIKRSHMPFVSVSTSQEQNDKVKWKKSKRETWKVDMICWAEGTAKKAAFWKRNVTLKIM